MRSGSSTTGGAVLRHCVHEHTPSSSATWTPVGAARPHRRRPQRRPAGEQHLGVHVRRRLGPVFARTIGVDAAPPSLAPHQSTRRPKQARSRTAIAVRSCASARTPQGAPNEVSCGRDGDRHLVGPLADLEHPEAVESQQPLGKADTVVHRQGSSRCCLRTAATMAGELTAFVDPSAQRARGHAFHSNAKSHITPDLCGGVGYCCPRVFWPSPSKTPPSWGPTVLLRPGDVEVPTEQPLQATRYTSICQPRTARV